MIVDNQVQEYLRNLLDFKEDSMLELEEFAKKNHIPIIEPEVSKFLQMIVRLKNPKNVLELGTAIGYSSIVMKKSKKDLEITTIEKNHDMVKLANANIKKFGFEDSINIIESDAYEYLLSSKGTFDMIFIDAAKGQYLKYFKESSRLLSKNGIIVCDNVLFKGMVCDENSLTKRHRMSTIVRRLNHFLEYISNLDDFKTTIVPIDDGMSISYKI